MHLPESMPAGMTFNRFKHTRAALLLWTCCIFAAGFAVATFA